MSKLVIVGQQNRAETPPAAPAPRMPAGRTSSRRLALNLLMVPLMLFITGNLILAWRWRHYQDADFFISIRRIYSFNTVMMPAVLLLDLLTAGALWLRRRRSVLRNTAVALAAGLLVLGGTRLYATHIEPYRLQVRRVTLPTPKLSQRLRIVHISDIQTAAVGAYERRVFEIIRSLQPDLVLNTGDLMQPVSPATYTSEKPPMEALLRSLTPRYGVFNVTGDTDGQMVLPFEAGFGGMRTLFNQEAEFQCGTTRVRLFGLDLDGSNGYDIHRRVDPWVARAKPEDLTILLGHRPNFILDVANLPIDLCLAGHTHGGQVRVPGYGAIMTLSRIPREWASGYREVGRTRLDVSGAVGSEHIHDLPAIRINCPPELTVIDLVPEEKGKK